MAPLRLMMVAQDPALATYIAANGVDRIFVDLETIGKAERQSHLASWKSSQTLEDVSTMRAAVPDSELVVRINPLHHGSRVEIDEVVARGGDRIMLPMFRTVDELEEFFALVGGRAATLPLFETAASVRMLPELVGHPSLQELHIGLNDLHIDLQMDFLFQPLAQGFLEDACAALREAGIAFGLGGLARAGEGIVSPEYLLGEHVRLGSSGAILSQTFHRNAKSVAELVEETDFGSEIAALRRIYAGFCEASEAQLETNRLQTADRVNDVVNLIRAKRGAG